MDEVLFKKIVDAGESARLKIQNGFFNPLSSSISLKEAQQYFLVIVREALEDKRSSTVELKDLHYTLPV